MAETDAAAGAPDAAAPDPVALVSTLRTWARELDFAQLAVARVALDQDAARLAEWIDAGYHGSMTWLTRNQDKRRLPARLVDGTVSVISVRMDYLPEPLADAIDALDHPARAYISRYTLGRDYHKTLRSRLRRLGERLASRIGPFGYRVFTDSAPVLERALARDAGLGWIGKHTNLIDRGSGSLFFLGEIYTDLALPADLPVSADHCGSCTRCIEVCPTDAIVAPYVLDARRCISYLTIESREPIPVALRKAIGNRVFGCDDCQLKCPWNRYARVTAVSDFAPRHGLDQARLVDLFRLSADDFDDLTRGSALRRVSYTQWLRNLAVALGNAATTPELIAALEQKRDHADKLVREHVGWALAQHARADADAAD